MPAFEITSYSLLSALAAWSSALVSWTAWRRRTVPGARALAWLMASITVWTFGAAVELAVVRLADKILWSKVEYLGTTTVPVLFLLFAIEYTQHGHWLTRPRVALAFAVPAVTLALAWTNEQHGLIWAGYAESPAGQNLLVYERGPWFWIGGVAYSYLCVVAAMLLLAEAIRRRPPGLRAQGILVLSAAAIPSTANLLYVTHLFPLAGLEPTPISFALMGAVFAIAIFRYRLLDLVPVARDLLLEKMRDGVLVLDRDDRVLESNPSARRLLGAVADRGVGRPAAEVLAAWPGLLERLGAESQGRAEIVVAGEQERILDVSVSPLRGRGGERSGRLLLLRDVSDRHRSERALQAANQQLREQLAEIEALQSTLREQVLRDPLTGLFNRRYLEETLARELDRARREGDVLSLAILDLDHFKRLNDTLGHAAGDEVLRRLGDLLRVLTRRSDIACRFGGEEFVILMPGAPLEAARERAEEWRAAFAAAAAAALGVPHQPTLSAGLAAFPQHGESVEALMGAADAALYAAKAGGRNRIEVAAVTESVS